MEIKPHKGKGEVEYSYPLNHLLITKGKRTCAIFLDRDNKTIHVSVSTGYKRKKYASIEISFDDFRKGLLDLIESKK